MQILLSKEKIICIHDWRGCSAGQSYIMEETRHMNCCWNILDIYDINGFHIIGTYTPKSVILKFFMLLPEYRNKILEEILNG